MRLLALALSFAAFMPAAYASQWRLMNEQRQQAVTADQIRTIFDRDLTDRFDWLRRANLNAQLVGQHVPYVVGMNLLTSTYRWDGMSICDSNDPRLMKQIDSGMLRFANGETRSWNMMLEERDPCAFNFVEPTRQFTDGK